MNILEVIPLLNLPKSQPQKFTYFSSQALKFGALVEVSVGRKNIEALVINSKPLNNKIEIKNLGYSLKPIKKILNNEVILTKEQWLLIQWLAEYYYLSLSGLLRFALPNKNLLRRLNFSINSNEGKKELAKNYYLVNENLEILKQKIRECLHGGRQVFILVPNYIRLEIYLEKLKEFSDDLIIFDRQLSIKKSQMLYANFSNNKKIIISRRNGIFAPFQNLGLIIVDEEENQSLETWETKIHFNAKIACFALSKIFSADLLLTSSNPSVESWNLIKNNSFEQIGDLAKNNFKNLTVIKTQKLDRFSDELKLALSQILDKGGQALIFANRKGFSTALICGDCGYIAKCPNCDVALTYYQNSLGNKMYCHHCNFEKATGNICPDCRSHLIKFVGTGTQKITKMLQDFYPKVRIVQFDSDILKTLKHENEILKQFVDKKIDILVITELFLKFLDKLINPVDLVVVYSADQSLIFPDFKNEEHLLKTFNKLNRASKQMIVQTLKPENEFFVNIGQLDKFYENELELRSSFNYPPFTDLIKIEVLHKNFSQLDRLANHLHQIIKKNSDRLLGADNYTLMPPNSGFIPKIKNLYIKEIIWKIKIKSQSLTTLEVIRKRNKILDLMPDDAKIKINPINLV